MRNLYEEEDFFHEIANAEYGILDELIEKKENTEGFDFPDQLSSIVFEDSSLQHVFYLMLKGSKHSPSLLNFITFDSSNSTKNEKTNLMFASNTLLEAVFQNDGLTQRVIEERNHLWKKILEEEESRYEKSILEGKRRSEWRKEIQESINSTFMAANISPDMVRTFDFSLGEVGNVLLIQDPKTGRVFREKHQSKERSF